MPEATQRSRWPEPPGTERLRKLRSCAARGCGYTRPVSRSFEADCRTRLHGGAGPGVGGVGAEVRAKVAPIHWTGPARVAESVYAVDLKSTACVWACGFESHPGHAVLGGPWR